MNVRGIGAVSWSYWAEEVLRFQIGNNYLLIVFAYVLGIDGSPLSSPN